MADKREIKQLEKDVVEWARLSCADLEETHNFLVELHELVNAKDPDHEKIKSFVIEWYRLFTYGKDKPPLFNEGLPPVLRLIKGKRKCQKK